MTKPQKSKKNIKKNVTKLNLKISNIKKTKKSLFLKSNKLENIYCHIKKAILLVWPI